MVEYSVVLKRWTATRPNVCIFRDENRELALKEMHKYCQKNGFTVQDTDGRFTVKDIVLVEKEPIAGSPIISETSYHLLFND